MNRNVKKGGDAYDDIRNSNDRLHSNEFTHNAVFSYKKITAPTSNSERLF